MALGNVTATVDPLDRAAYHEYDALRRRVSTTTPLGLTSYFTYDANGRTTAVRDPLAQTVYYHYDATGQRIATLDPLGNPTYYAYDALGRQTTETDAVGDAQTVVYDAAGRIEHNQNGEGLVTYYEHNAVGRRILTHATPGSGVGDCHFYYEYDAVGRMTRSISDNFSNLEWLWEYDAAGQVIGELQAETGSVYFGYDATGRRTSFEDTGGNVTYHNFDARGSVETVTDPWNQTVYFERDEVRAETARVFPMGSVSYMNYDLASQTTSILHTTSGGSVPASLYYTYDGDGRPTEIEGKQDTLLYTRYFGYDDASRLTSEDWLDESDVSMYAFTWAYDAAGNRTSQEKNGVETSYDHNTLNQLTHEETDSAHTYYEYDKDGHLHDRKDAASQTYFAWFFDDRLRKVNEVGGDEWWYKYIEGGRRWRKRNIGETTRTDFVYDGEKVAEEQDYDGDTQTVYTHAGSSIYQPVLAQRTSDASEWFIGDMLGSTLGLLDSNEALTLSLLYDAWGNELLESGNGATPYRYVGAYGYYDDTESGLSYLWRRYYDRGVGRFISRDPVWSALSRYAYVRNRATGAVDPSGRQEVQPLPTSYTCMLLEPGELTEEECDEQYEDCRAANEEAYDECMAEAHWLYDACYDGCVSITKGKVDPACDFFCRYSAGILRAACFGAWTVGEAFCWAVLRNCRQAVVLGDCGPRGWTPPG